MMFSERLPGFIPFFAIYLIDFSGRVLIHLWINPAWMLGSKLDCYKLSQWCRKLLRGSDPRQQVSLTSSQ